MSVHVQCRLCERKARARGLCDGHYSAWLREANPTYAANQKASQAAWSERNPSYAREYRVRYKAERTLEQIEARAEWQRQWWAANREKKRLYRQKRKALERGAGGSMQALSHRAVAERDGWRCHICQKRVTEKTWSLDHLIPLSAGGTNTLANVALAHRACNAARGVDRLPAQLRLIG